MSVEQDLVSGRAREFREQDHDTRGDCPGNVFIGAHAGAAAKSESLLRFCPGHFFFNVLMSRADFRARIFAAPLSRRENNFNRLSRRARALSPYSRVLSFAFLLSRSCGKKIPDRNTRVTLSQKVPWQRRLCGLRRISD